MELSKFLQLKLNEILDPTSSYRSVLGSRWREDIKTHSKGSQIHTTIYNSIIVLIYKLNEANILTNDDCKKIMNFYNKPMIMTDNIVQNMDKIGLLAKIIPDPSNYPPIEKEENPELYRMFNNYSFDKGTVDYLTFDEKELGQIFNVMDNLKKFHYVFRAGKKFPGFAGLTTSRKSTLLQKVQNSESKEVYKELAKASQEAA